MTLLRNIIKITMTPIVRLALKVHEKSLSNKNVPCQLDEYSNHATTRRMYCLGTDDTTIDIATSRG